MNRRNFIQTAAGIILLPTIVKYEKRLWTGHDFGVKNYFQFVMAERSNYIVGYKVNNLTVKDADYIDQLFNKADFVAILDHIKKIQPTFKRI